MADIGRGFHEVEHPALIGGGHQVPHIRNACECLFTGTDLDKLNDLLVFQPTGLGGHLAVIEAAAAMDFTGFHRLVHRPRTTIARDDLELRADDRVHEGRNNISG